jgi:cystathionine beta-lyase/cystathionine gamma-synthase
MSNRQSPLGASTPLVPPLYQSSVYTLPDLDALDRIYDGEEGGFIYARDSHPNGKNLAARLAVWEGADWALVGGSGMASISTLVLALLQPGQRIVASNRLYGRTAQLFEQELSRFGVQSTLIDCNDLAAVETALASPARLLFVETISNPHLRVVAVPALAELAHRRKCLLVVDNTFATPVLTKPLELGADVVMESLTKIISGHSDVTLGMIAGKSEDLLPAVTATSSIWGFAANPFDCWLTERGLATLELRVRTACATAAPLAEWLTRQPGVSRVLYPGLPEHADHAIAAKVLRSGFGHVLCFDLAGGRDAVNRFIRQAPGIPFSPSLGHTATTLSHPWTTSHRFTSLALKNRLGITEGLVRLSVGIEDLAEIQGEITKGLG